MSVVFPLLNLICSYIPQPAVLILNSHPSLFVAKILARPLKHLSLTFRSALTSLFLPFAGRQLLEDEVSMTS